MQINLISRINHLQLLFKPTKIPKIFGSSHTVFWLILSLAVPVYFCLISLHQAFSREYVVQDDARQHVVWMQQLVDPQLFPDDLIANYFQSVAPTGFKLLYRVMAEVGIEPIVLAKILPILLGLITSVYCFGACLQIFPVPTGAFLATLILNQSIWLKDDVISATPRAFLYPLFAAFLYYLLKRSLFPCLAAIALQGLFYPQLLLVEFGILTVRLFRWQGKLPRFSQTRSDYIFWATGLAVTLLVMLPYALATSEYSPVVTAAQMKVMPEFAAEGRSKYFVLNPIEFWMNGDSGISLPTYPQIIWLSLLFPILLKTKAPLYRFINKKIKVIFQTLLASLVLFFMAHLLLLRLHFPNRYTSHSLRFVMALTAGISLTLLLDVGICWLSQKLQTNTPLKTKQKIVLGFVTLFCAAALIVPAIPGIFLSSQFWISGRTPELYQFFSQQPKDVLIASLANEVNNLPAFSQRSVLVGREFGFAYHTGYYNKFRQRVMDLMRAQYSPDMSELQSFIQNYGVDFFLLEQEAFRPDYITENKWLMQFEPAASEAIAHLRQQETPALAKLVDHCSSLEVQNFIVVEADCIVRVQPK